jgi:2,4-dienoyl-CoA reductase-like NADH-dependent reductase (Old Yellow Enzyme family)
LKRKFPALLSPLKVGGLTLKNPIVAAPMTYPILTSDGCLTPEAIAFYELRAKGGAAAVTVSEVIVDGKMGKYYPIQVVLDAPNAKDSLAMAARAIKRHGAVPSIELSHGGKYALTDGPALGPSDEFADGPRRCAPWRKTTLWRFWADTLSRQKCARTPGLRCFSSHAGHGWLLQQFLSRRRTSGRTNTAEAFPTGPA